MKQNPKVKIMEEMPIKENPVIIIVFLPNFDSAQDATAVPIALMIETKEDIRWPSYPGINLTEIAST